MEKVCDCVKLWKSVTDFIGFGDRLINSGRIALKRKQKIVHRKAYRKSNVETRKSTSDSIIALLCKGIGIA
jgi:hypothetical protein